MPPRRALAAWPEPTSPTAGGYDRSVRRLTRQPECGDHPGRQPIGLPGGWRERRSVRGQDHAEAPAVAVAGPLDVVVPQGESKVVVVLDHHRAVLDREGDLRVELGVVLRIAMVVVAV